MFHTRAIILSLRPYREHDELISFFTEQFGKQIVLARGSRKATSKLAPLLHSPRIVQCSFVAGRSFPILTSVDHMPDSAASDDFYGQYFLYALLTLCDDILYEGERDEKLWHLLSEVFRKNLGEERYNKKDWLLLYDRWLCLLLQALGVKRDSAAQRTDRPLLKRIFADTFHRNPYPLEPFVCRYNIMKTHSKRDATLATVARSEKKASFLFSRLARSKNEKNCDTLGFHK